MVLFAVLADAVSGLYVYACSVLHLCPTPCNPRDHSPPGSSVHGVFPGKNTGVGFHVLLQAIFLTQRSNPYLLHTGRFFTAEPLGKPGFVHLIFLTALDL